MVSRIHSLKKTLPFFISAAVLLLNVSLGWAEVTTKAGTITLVIGKASVERGTPAEVQPVHFRDPVYLKDSITTEEESFVRVLMGRKALVTVSEMSVLTITEDLHQATINLDSGFIGLSVARKRMDDGEYIEIRTPHAVAAVRGTKVMAEVPTPDITRLTVVEGHVDVYALSAPTQVISVSTLQSVQTTLTAPSQLKTLTPQALQKEQQRLNPPQGPNSDSTPSDTVVEKQFGNATKIAKNLTQETNSKQQTGAQANKRIFSGSLNSGLAGTPSGGGGTPGGNSGGPTIGGGSGPIIGPSLPRIDQINARRR